MQRRHLRRMHRRAFFATIYSSNHLKIGCVVRWAINGLTFYVLALMTT